MKTTITIKTSTIKASVHCAPDTRDTRYYLNGVLMKARCDKLSVVSTTGQLLSAFSDDIDPVEEPFEIIVPIEAVKLALKSKARILQLVELDNGRWSLGDCIFTPIFGRFPDYARVIPTVGKSGDEQHLGIQPKYLTAAIKALNDYYDDANAQMAHSQDNIDGLAVFHRGDSRAVVVVSPWGHTKENPKKHYVGFRG